MKNICFFGCYLKEYSRNISFFEGMNKLKYKYMEIHKEPNIEKLDSQSDIGIKNILKKLLFTAQSYMILLKPNSRLKDVDAIVVLYPGHLFLPAAWIQSKIYKKKLVFDSFISIYNSLVEDKKIIKEHSLKAKALKKIESILLALPDKILVDSKVKKEIFSKNFNIDKKKIISIPLTTSSKIYFPKNKVKTSKIVVTFFGLYNPLQGVQYIAEAANKLKNNNQIKIVMIGDGNGKDEIVKYTIDHKIKNITFYPRLKETDLVKKIQQSDILLGIFSSMKSAKIALPNKAVAAIACKKALICAELPAMTEHFTHKKNIFFCKPENSKSLADSILTVSRNKKLRDDIAENGYALYREKFIPEVITNQLMSI